MTGTAMQRHHCHLLRKVAIDLKNDVFGGEWYDGESSLHALRSNENSWEAACLGHQQDLKKRRTRAARNLICVRVCVEQLVLASSTPVAGRRETLFYGEPDSNLSWERDRGQWHTNRPFLCELVTSVHRGLPTSWLWKMLTQTQTSQRIAWLKAAEILPCRASLPFLCSLLPSLSWHPRPASVLLRAAPPQNDRSVQKLGQMSKLQTFVVRRHVQDCSQSFILSCCLLFSSFLALPLEKIRLLDSPPRVLTRLVTDFMWAAHTESALAFWKIKLKLLTSYK